MIFYRRRTIIDYIKYLIFKTTSEFIEFDDKELSMVRIYPERKNFEYGLSAYYVKYEDITSIKNIDSNNLIIRGKFEIVKSKYDPISTDKEIMENYEIHINSSYKNFSKLKNELYMKIYDLSGMIRNQN